MMLINPYILNSGIVNLLLHFDGTNGATTFTDSSPNNVTVTTLGTAKLSTGTKQLGTASLYLPATTAYATVPATSANFAGANFCIDCWVNPTTRFSIGNIMGHSLAATSYVGFNLQWKTGTSKIRLLSGWTGSVWTIDSTSSADVPTGSWTHIAVTREGQVLRVFINGVKDIEINSASTLWAENAGGNFGIGSGAGGNRFGVGYIDEFRIVKNNAVYTSNFTPPTTPY